MKLLVPTRDFSDRGFLENEWVLKLSLKKQDLALCFHLEVDHCFVAFAERPAYRAAPDATLPVFLQRLKSDLEGQTVTGVTTVAGDRMLRFEFSGGALEIDLIPKRPNARWISAGKTTELSKGASERKAAIKTGPEPIVRDGVRDLARLHQTLESELVSRFQTSSLSAEAQAIQKRIREIDKKIAKARDSLAHIQAETNPAVFGETLKEHLAEFSDVANWRNQTRGRSTFELFSSAREETLAIPLKAGLSAADLMRTFFERSKKRARTEAQARSALDSLQSDRSGLERDLTRLGDRATLPSSTKMTKEKQKAPLGWTGPAFESSEGLWILIGRNKNENLKLTLKTARGRDLWMHMKGRASSHALIVLDGDRTPSLETLLMAARLVLKFSGVRSADKYEIDYTLRKNVKRIPRSDQVSYTQNKTLLVDLEETETSPK